ncbi:hypothetical protein F2981_06815 [Sinorhizobium meliloti]|nr:hypothetical protein [Sinorhizobium meliloti]
MIEAPLQHLLGALQHQASSGDRHRVDEDQCGGRQDRYRPFLNRDDRETSPSPSPGAGDRQVALSGGRQESGGLSIACMIICGTRR